MATINPYNAAAAITKSDTVNLDGSTFSATALPPAVPCQAVYVGGAGIVAAVFAGGNNVAVNFTAVAGELLPIAAIRVNSTNTTATLMVALYQL